MPELPDDDPLVSDVRDAVPDARAAWLFGSRTQGRLRTDSDIDVDKLDIDIDIVAAANSTRSPASPATCWPATKSEQRP